MIRRMLILYAVITVVAAFGLPGTTVRAAEIKVLTSVALTAALNELAPAFEKATGDKLNIVYGLAAEMRKRVLEGESSDVIMITRPMMEELQKQNRLAAGGLVNVVGTPVAVAARAGAPKPDIGTVEAFKRTLLAAKSIVYADPVKGGVSGIVFARVLERLGIADQMKRRASWCRARRRPRWWRRAKRNWAWRRARK
jgi:molybdate transport system substrate-binding protein